MAAPKRPNLMGLVEAKSRPIEVVEAMPQTEPVSDRAPTEVPSAGPSDLKTMQVRVNRAGWLEMSRLAQDRDIPLETLMVEAFNDVLVKHRKPPVVERRQPARK